MTGKKMWKYFSPCKLDLYVGIKFNENKVRKRFFSALPKQQLCKTGYRVIPKI